MSNMCVGDIRARGPLSYFLTYIMDLFMDVGVVELIADKVIHSSFIGRSEIGEEIKKYDIQMGLAPIRGIF